MAVQSTVVGSYPVPAWLAAFPTGPHRVDAVMTVVATQELAGIDVVTDGELSRFDVNHPETNGMIDYFVGQLDGIRTQIRLSDLNSADPDDRLAFRRRPAGVVTGPIGPGTLNLPAAAAELRRLARAKTKFTLTSPFMLARTLLDHHYGDPEKLCMAIAEVLRAQIATIDTDVIQIDEAHITGHPEDTDLAATAINHILDDIQTERAVHLCFGNYGGQTIQHGHYEKLLPFMNTLHTDSLLLELAHRDPAELHTLRGLDTRIGIGLGVIDIKNNTIENPTHIAHHIELATQTLGPNRIHYINPDCGFWMLPRTIANAKMHAMVQGRNLFAGSTPTATE